MLCPKCKTEINETALRCPDCGVKVRSKCPACGTLNKANALKCVNCDKELLRRCSACGAFNLPASAVCRKCSNELVIIEKKIEILQEEQSNLVISSPTEENIEFAEQKNKTIIEENESLEHLESSNVGEQPVFSAQEVSEEIIQDEKEQQEVKNLIVNSMMNSGNIMCAMIAPEGRGKSFVLDLVRQDLVNAKVNVLSMESSPVTQLSPYGLFQDLFLSASGLPNYYVTEQQNESEFVKLLEQSFGLTSDDACELFELLYPTKTAYYETILHNKEKLKTIIKKIFLYIRNSGEFVITIDDFDLIDASSFELLGEMCSEGIIDESLKMLVTVQTQKNIDAFMQLTQMPENKSENFYLAKMSDDAACVLMKNILNNFEPFDESFKEKILRNANGSPNYIGQLLLYMNEAGMFNYDGTSLTCLVDSTNFAIPIDMNAIVVKRLEQIKIALPQVYTALIYSTMLGVKFNVVMLQAAMNMDQEQVQELLQQLMALAFIKPYNDEWLKFTNSALWRCLFEYVKQDELYAQCANTLLSAIEPLRLSNVAYKPLLALNCGNKEIAFTYWTEVVKTSAYLGDVNLYVLAQKQCLKLNEELALPEKTVIDTNIRLRLGKLLSVAEPVLALEFLSTILSLDIEQNDAVNFIDVASYAVIAANNAGNYNAVIELVDNTVQLLQPAEKYRLEIALITARKIKTMLYLGNFAQLINIIENEINPQLTDALSQNYTVYDLPISKIFETWLNTNFVLADAYIMQGNNKVYNVIADLEEAISAHGEEVTRYKQMLSLVKAFASTLKGEIAEAQRLMDGIVTVAAEEPMEADFVCRYNLLQVLIRFMKKDLSNMKTYLYEAVTFANNSSDYLGKNLLKSALGKVLENEGDFNKSFEIYNDQITYFAKERIAVGALLTWYLIADLCLKVSDVDKSLEVAMNALEVAKNPKINSYYFQVMYKRLIAEIYLIKGDFESTKMYLEKSLLITKKFNLEYLNIHLYDFYAKYHIEMFKSGNDGGSSPLVSAKKLYEKAITLASRLGLLNIVEEMKQEYQSLLTFAQLKKVNLN